MTKYAVIMQFPNPHDTDRIHEFDSRDDAEQYVRIVDKVILGNKVGVEVVIETIDSPE